MGKRTTVAMGKRTTVEKITVAMGKRTTGCAHGHYEGGYQTYRQGHYQRYRQTGSNQRPYQGAAGWSYQSEEHQPAATDHWPVAGEHRRPYQSPPPTTHYPPPPPPTTIHQPPLAAGDQPYLL